MKCSSCSFPFKISRLWLTVVTGRAESEILGVGTGDYCITSYSYRVSLGTRFLIDAPTCCLLNTQNMLSVKGLAPYGSIKALTSL